MQTEAEIKITAVSDVTVPHGTIIRGPDGIQFKVIVPWWRRLLIRLGHIPKPKRVHVLRVRAINPYRDGGEVDTRSDEERSVQEIAKALHRAGMTADEAKHRFGWFMRTMKRIGWRR